MSSKDIDQFHSFNKDVMASPRNQRSQIRSNFSDPKIDQIAIDEERMWPQSDDLVSDTSSTHKNRRIVYDLNALEHEAGSSHWWQFGKLNEVEGKHEH